MGLPEIIISFKTAAATIIQRSARGIVLLILDEPTKAGFTTIRGVEDIGTGWSTQNLDYINKTLLGTPNRILVYSLGEEEALGEALSAIKLKRFNYLAYPDASSEDMTTIATLIKAQRDNARKTFKAVLANEVADHEGIINFTTSGITVGEDTYTAAQYTARIAGILAGLPLNRSATYFVLPEVDAIDEIEDPDEAIDNGELILIDDGENVKIGRGVNSFTSTTPTKGESFQKIKIIEGMDLVRDDIRKNFADNYVGKVINDYDNKMLFVTSVNGFLADIEGDVLDASADNRTDVDEVAQRLLLQQQGVDLEELSDTDIRAYNTGSRVFLRANARFVDTMEDLEFDIYM